MATVTIDDARGAEQDGSVRDEAVALAQRLAALVGRLPAPAQPGTGRKPAVERRDEDQAPEG